jgi:CBS domain-containing protein
MAMAQKVRDVMEPEPLTIDARTSIEAAAHLMRARDVADAIVLDSDRMVGVLTNSDIVVFAIAAGRHPATILAGDCCDAEWPSVAADDTASTAFQVMVDHDLERVPVLEGERLVGAVSYDRLRQVMV